MNHDFNNPVILFDGLCNLCEGSVQFILKHDHKKQFRFASLQSSIAEELLSKFARNASTLDSFILIEDGILYYRSTAALRVCRRLNGLYPVLYVFILVPAFIRDSIYKLIARNRYQWFGKKNECWLPTPEIASRFLDQNDLHRTELPAG